MAQSAQKRICPKHFVLAMEPVPIFQCLFSTCFGIFDKNNNFLDKFVAFIPIFTSETQRVRRVSG